MLLFVMFGLFQRNSLILLTVTGLVGIGQGVSWLSPLYALWVFWRLRWHWTLLVYLLVYAFFVYLWFAL